MIAAYVLVIMLIKMIEAYVLVIIHHKMLVVFVLEMIVVVPTVQVSPMEMHI